MNEKERADAVIAFETQREGVSALGRSLDALPHWRPAKALRVVVTDYETRLASMKARFDSKPVVSVVGPTGSGKSTLVNALVGADDAVVTGNSRPTTRGVAIIARTVTDAATLLNQFPEEKPDLATLPTTALPDALLLDTPDTDSAECERHRPLLEAAMRLSDALVCVFDASNPKRRDNVDALKTWVDSFSGEYVFIVLNRCDRIPEAELRNDILPDFRSYIAQTWTRKPGGIFLVSARGGMGNPQWTEEAPPLHNLNELDKLRSAISKLSGSRVFADHRVKQAQHLRETAEELVREAASESTGSLGGVEAEMAELDKSLADKLAEAVSMRADEESEGITASLCGALARRWWGPVGIYIGLWRRLVDFRSPFSVLRLLNPVTLAATMARSAKIARDPEKYERELSQSLGEGMSGVDCTSAQRTFLERWPSIADSLVAAGFDDSVRDAAGLGDLAPALGHSHAAWGESINAAVRKEADRLSHPIYIWLLNLPSIVAAVWIGVLVSVNWHLATVQSDPGKYLSGNFFGHSILLLLFWWLPPSWLLQIRVNRAAKKIPARALKLAEPVSVSAGRGIAEEVSLLRRLSSSVSWVSSLR